MTFKEIEAQIKRYEQAGKTMFVTSSFQTHSIVLLHIISRINREIPVYFINTGFLFPETILYRNLIAKTFNLNVINAYASVPKSQQKDREGNLFFASDPDYCCFLNKIQPLDPILAQHDIWINGVRADQTAVRKAMKVEEQSKFNTTRFHPMLDWTKQEIYKYIREHQLPRHPLDEQAYLSIGCEPCTRKVIPGDERSSRWYGLNKTECGLNTELVNK